VALYDKAYHLEQLGHVNDTMERLEASQYAHVRQARLGGATWQEIADQLGITRQAAHIRWSKRINNG
jgi:DNA-directed RNA polymerase specialized sigma24 family protein